MKDFNLKYSLTYNQDNMSQQNQQKCLFLMIWPGSKLIKISAYPDQDKILLQYQQKYVFSRVFMVWTIIVCQTFFF